MLGIFLTTDKGTALVFIAGIFIFPVLFSIISIIAKLIFFKKKKYYLIRPLLTIAIFILILAIANWTYDSARTQAINAARKIHEHCNAHQLCPTNPLGWEVDGKRIKKNDLGSGLKYPASYQYDPNGFTIRVYQGPDMGDIITGGIDTPFKVEQYIEK